jgi:hypothetical protein
MERRRDGWKTSDKWKIEGDKRENERRIGKEEKESQTVGKIGKKRKEREMMKGNIS